VSFTSMDFKSYCGTMASVNKLTASTFH